MAGYETVDPPRGLSYGAPLVDFSQLANWPNAYYQGQQNRRQQDIATAFQNGLPTDPATGAPDYGKIMQVLAQKGDINAIPQLGQLQQQATLRNQAGQVSPLLSGASPAAPQPAALPAAAAPQPAPTSPIAVTSLPAPPASGLNSGDVSGSVVDVVTAKLPQDSSVTGAVINNIARAVGVDANAPLTPAQSARVQQLTDAYVRRRGPTTAPAAAPAAPGGQAMSPAATSTDNAAAPSRIGATFADMAARSTNGDITMPPASAALAARTVSGTGQQEPAAQPAPSAAPAVAPAAATAPPVGPAAAPHPIMPEPPLPPGFKPGQEQQAILALRAEAARRAQNPYDKQAPLLEDWAKRIENWLQPIKLGQSDTIIDSRTGQVLAQGPAAAAFAAHGPSQTLDADAERYRQTGTLPPNMGRGVQGQAEAQAIRTRAAEMEIAEGGNPANWPNRWQEYRATGVGLNTSARVKATREENLNLILKVADAAIPAALEASAKVNWRSGINPLTNIIQRGQVMASDPDLKEFGMANLQLAEHWARAMNPTGVMRESDRDKALQFLSTQDTPETYRRAVMQLKKQITRERDAIEEGNPRAVNRKDVPAPGVDDLAAPNRKTPAAPPAGFQIVQ